MGSEEEVLHVDFNQDYTTLVVGTSGGYALMGLGQLDLLERMHETRAMGGVKIVERLFSSSLMAIVTISSPRKLRVCHFRKGNEICSYSYVNTILTVKLNRARLVVCLENSLHIHNIRDMKLVHTIRDTPLNEQGIMALTVNEDNSWLAYPGSSNTGQVQVFDAFNLQAKIVIHAHASPVAALAFNIAGTLLATASKKGTVIRVFSTSDGCRMFEFRRGMKRCADVYSISFSPDDTFLAMSSNTETVHVFRLDNQSEVKEEQTPTSSNSWMEWVRSSLPTQVTEVLAQGRAFATITTPFVETRSVVAVTSVKGSEGKDRVIVASYDGFLYIYGLNTQEGGECPLLKQYKMFTAPLAPEIGLFGEGDVKLSPNPTGSASYAGVVKGRHPQSMSDSDKMAEIRNALDQPLTSNNDSDFPLLDDK